MRLEINTNGAWRLVIDGMGAEDTREARKVVATLCEIHRKIHGGRRTRKLAFRLISEADGAPVAHIETESGAGWREWPQ